jgi:predicted RNase H-like nuclease (RuvC/YqgF family)
MALRELDKEPRAQISEAKNQVAEKRVVIPSQTDEIQKAQSEVIELRKALNLKDRELEEYRSRLQEHEQNFQAQRSTWQCELTEKQLLLQGRNAEIEQSKSDIAALRKRVRELESTSKQALAPLPINVASKEKSSKIFGSRRWRTTKGRKRRWKA